MHIKFCPRIKIFDNETQKIIDLLKILNSKIVLNVAQFLEIWKCLKIFHFLKKTDDPYEKIILKQMP